MSENQIIIFLVQIFLLLGLSRLLGIVLFRLKQPALTAEIAVGVILGPTILGRFFPEAHLALFPNDPIQIAMFETVAWLGVFFFLMEAGLEVDFSSAWRQRGQAMTIAVMDIVVPMVLGFTLAWFLPSHYLVSPDQKIIFSLFMATILTVSAMPITVRALKDLNLSKTDMGFLIMSALSVNDIIGWLLFTIVFGYFIQSNLPVPSLLKILIGAGAFVLFCLTWGRHLSNWIINFMKKRQLPEPGSSLTFLFLLGLICGALAHRVGLHALFGFFLAGVIAGEAKNLSEKTRSTIGQMVYAIFVPIFFAGIGLKMDFLQHFDPFLTLFVAVVGIGVRFLGAWWGVGLTDVFKENRLIISICHTPGGMMEIVMGMIALHYNLITPVVFESIVFGALITAMVMGPWLSWAVSRRKNISVFDFFSRRGMVVPLNVKSREEAIAVLCEKAAQECAADESCIKNCVLEREHLMATAMEHGVAIPHGRVEGLIRPVIVFGRSLSGIEWNSPDGNPSHFIFLILTPKDDESFQVQILRSIAKVMSHPVTAQAILGAKDASGVWMTLQAAFTQLYIQKERHDK